MADKDINIFKSCTIDSVFVPSAIKKNRICHKAFTPGRILDF